MNFGPRVWAAADGAGAGGPDPCLRNASPVQPHLPGSRPAPTGALHPAGAWRCSGRFSNEGPGKWEGGGEANCGAAGDVTSARRLLPRKHLRSVSACDMVVDVRSRPRPPGSPSSLGSVTQGKCRKQVRLSQIQGQLESGLPEKVPDAQLNVNFR